MSGSIEQLCQDIGAAAVAAAGADLAGRLLVYAEAEPGVISTDVAYLSEQTGGVRLRVGPAAVKRAVYEFWERWREQPENQEWRALCYLLEDGRFSIDLAYPGDLGADEGVSERRPRAISKYFGALPVEYLRP